MKNIAYLCCVLLLSVGCASVETQYSGFLNDYSAMKPSEVVEGLLVQKHPTKNIGDYEKFFVEPVEVRLHEDAKGHDKVEPEKLEELSTYFYDQAVLALTEGYTVVDKEGEGVLVVRAAITDAFASKPYLNLHWSTTAIGKGLGGASMEAEFIDAVTREQILAVVDARLGKRLHYTKGLTKWGHTEDIINGWVKLLISTLGDSR